MSLRSIIGRFIGNKSSTLRNKPGGMAWINSAIDDGCGSAQLLNRVVRTVRLKPSGMWEIEPIQSYRATRPVRFTSVSDRVYLTGDLIHVDGIADIGLTPIPGDLCTDEEVRDLYAPKIPEAA
jgi:hypothetical protein